MTYEEWTEWLALNPMQQLHRDQIFNMANKCIEHLNNKLGRALVERDNAKRDLAALLPLDGGARAIPVYAVVQSIVTAVATDSGITADRLGSRSRVRAVAYARHVVWWLCRELTSLSLNDIGSVIGSYDHSSVLHGINTVDAERLDGYGHRWDMANRVLCEIMAVAA